MIKRRSLLIGATGLFAAFASGVSFAKEAAKNPEQPHDQVLKIFEKIKHKYSFEFNDDLTRKSLIAFSKEELAKIDLYDFSVICDERNNSSSIIDNNDLKIIFHTHQRDNKRLMYDFSFVDGLQVWNYNISL